MWTSSDLYRDVRPEPDFYLPRILGGKLAVFVALLLLYLCVSDQLARYLSPSVVNLGFAHVEASVMLALFGGGDAITTFRYGHKYYDLTRHMVAHGDLFAACWRAVLWQIERGTILACGLTLAPPVLWQGMLILADLWNPPLPEPHPAKREQQAPATYSRAAPSPPSFVPSSRLDETLEEADRTIDPGAADAPALPGPEIRKRPRKAKKVGPPDEETTPPPAPPPPPIMEPGQVRKRRKPEG